MDALDGSATVIPAFVFTRLFDNHGRVGFKEQNLAKRIEGEVDSPVVEP
jgi:hypothetical protein